MTHRAALPDLDTLNPEALKALIVAQHEQLVSKEEQLASRDEEIDRLKLLIAKLRRVKFGCKSEKLDRQIEQLELRLDELETSRAQQLAASPTPLGKWAAAILGFDVRQAYITFALRPMQARTAV